MQDPDCEFQPPAVGCVMRKSGAYWLRSGLYLELKAVLWRERSGRGVLLWILPMGCCCQKNPQQHPTSDAAFGVGAAPELSRGSLPKIGRIKRAFVFSFRKSTNLGNPIPVGFSALVKATGTDLRGGSLFQHFGTN